MIRRGLAGVRPTSCQPKQMSGIHPEAGVRRGRWRGRQNVQVGDHVGDEPEVVTGEVVRLDPVVPRREGKRERAVFVDHAVAAGGAGVVLRWATGNEADLGAGVAVEDEEVDAAPGRDAVAAQAEALRALGVGHGWHTELLVPFEAGEDHSPRLGQIGVAGGGAAGRARRRCTNRAADGHRSQRRAERRQSDKRPLPRAEGLEDAHGITFSEWRVRSVDRNGTGAVPFSRIRHGVAPGLLFLGVSLKIFCGQSRLDPVLDAFGVLAHVG